LTKWAADNGIPGDIQSWIQNEKVKKAIMADIEKVGKEAKLQGFEFIKEVHLTTDTFTVDNDMMTPSFKLRRAQILKAYQKQVDEMYKKIGE